MTPARQLADMMHAYLARIEKLKPMCNFPLYQSENVARANGCLVCVRPLQNAIIEDSGYPPGRGRWAMCCRACGCWTFFDLAPEPVDAD